MIDVGWSLAVGHRGEVVHTECTGPHGPSTRFDIASTSKQFTALAALLTVPLDEEVWRLLHHQSGRPDYIDLLKTAGHSYLEPTTTDEHGGRYGAGIFVADVDHRRVLYHHGDWSGFESVFVVDPEARVAVALSANQPGLITHQMGLDRLREWRQRL